MTNNFLTDTFVAPSGYTYTIREENGADEETISNPVAARDFMNFSNFISEILVHTDFKDHKLTPKEVLEIPLLDRYMILIKSRILSLGPVLEFTYTWPGDTIPTHYEQDLNELLFSSYESDLSSEEIAEKPDAIPFYNDRDLLKGIQFKNYCLTLTSGKEIQFDLADGNTERNIAMLPEDKQTRNSELIARNLKLKVGEKFEKVQEFSLFTIREMAEIRSAIASIDPTYSGTVDIENPRTGEKIKYPIFQAPRFFFLTEA